MSKRRTRAQKKKVASKRGNTKAQSVMSHPSATADLLSKDSSKSTKPSSPKTKSTDKSIIIHQQFANLLSKASTSPDNSAQPTKSVSFAERPIIRTEPNLIKRDLLKSLLVSLLLLSLLLGIYLIARYNVVSLPFLM